MLIKMMRTKIHRAVVTTSDLNYEGSIAIDEILLEEAGLIPFEAVHVWNINTGARLETYALPAARNTGEICLNGAAARLAQPGDLVIISSFAWMTEEDAKDHAGRVVLVDARNRITFAGRGLQKSLTSPVND
jgi:aspartate 1-decarboxylase